MKISFLCRSDLPGAHPLPHAVSLLEYKLPLLVPSAKHPNGSRVRARARARARTGIESKME